MTQVTSPRIVALVQARMGSSRLPGKVLMDIAGRPMLWHVVHRARRATLVHEVVVATSTNQADEAIESFARANGVACYRGSEHDVLDRFYQGARQAGADVIVRVTADCPLLDPTIMDKVIVRYLSGDVDYVTNTLTETYPDGLDAEVMSFWVLEEAWKEARLPSEREHVTPYVHNSTRFRVANVENRDFPQAGSMRWTVDEPQDLDFVRAVYTRLGAQGQEFGFEDVLRLLEREPQLMDLNKGITRNAGYFRSLANNPPVAARPLKLDRSRELRKRAERLIPSCSQTFSKGPTQYVQGVAPAFLARGQGSHVWDVDGNEYIDYPMALGPVILGHNYPAVTEAVDRQAVEGTSFSLPHPLEVEVAELLVEMLPCAEMVRFGKNGSDATSGAVRVARAFTGRDVIACCGYHGWQDWYVGTTTRSKGVPEAVRRLTVPFEYNNIASLERIFEEHQGEVAAVIMEPVGVVEPRDTFLQQVADLTRREGAVFIYDEVVTGFRLARGGAQEYYGVLPDLACVGKAMANGYPVAAVVGRRDIMALFDEVFFSFTFGGEMVSLAAAKATLQIIRDEPVIEHLWTQGRRLQDGYNELARRFDLPRITECIGLPPRTVAVFRDDQGEESLLRKSLFQQECLLRGILFSGNHNLCYSHSAADIDMTLSVYEQAMAVLADAVRNRDERTQLRGEPVQPVFRRA